MKIFIYILMGLALTLIVFNAIQMDFSNISSSNNVISLICIAASLCALCILLILNTAKKINEKTGK
ncbi:hypothetical protein [Flavobacterium rhizosphaerae]|uniref:Uncharacterized protein n=1 Tax=Flavobacterium rhizosphaerae TaxID=3163298 RepID=A0ABW8YXE9_9FLAO